MNIIICLFLVGCVLWSSILPSDDDDNGGDEASQEYESCEHAESNDATCVKKEYQMFKVFTHIME